MANTVDNSENSESPRSDHPAYEISADEVDGTIRLTYKGVTIAESQRALLYRESRLPPVYYFPREDVRMDLMRRTRHRTHCPFKGNASYWSLKVGDQQVENTVWSYESPFEDALAIKGYLAFWLEKLGVTYDEDGNSNSEQARMGSHGSVYVDWLLRQGWDTKNPSELTESLGKMLDNGSAPVARLSVFLRTLHPLQIGRAHV